MVRFMSNSCLFFKFQGFYYFFLFRIRRSPAWNLVRMRQRFSWDSAINQSRSMMSNLGQLFSCLLLQACTHCTDFDLSSTNVDSRRVRTGRGKWPGSTPRWCFDHMSYVRNSFVRIRIHSPANPGPWSAFRNSGLVFAIPVLKIPD